MESPVVRPGVRRAGAIALLLGAAVACARPPALRNVVLISIDTCRADHLSAYGYERPTSPFLEQLAARGVLFERAFCQVPDTTPSHTSLFTSIQPDAHGSANGVPYRGPWPTLAQTLRRAGLRTAAFVSGLTLTARRSGLGRGFEVYDDELTRVGSHGARRPNERRAEQTLDRALAWLEQQTDAPFFLFVHLFDPHALYEPPPPYDRLFPPEPAAGVAARNLTDDQIPAYARLGEETDLAHYVARYDGEIRYVDDQLRRLDAALEQRGLRDSTLLVVTSDHGEDLGEHDLFFSHGWRLYDPALHVPLILSAPTHLPAGLRVGRLVESIDVVPTVLDLLGLPAPPGQQGRSLLPLVRGEPGPATHFVLARTTKTRTYLGLSQESDASDYHALRGRRWKLVRSEDGATRMLFDLQRDPGEQRDVLHVESRAGRTLERLLAARLARMPSGAPGPAADPARDAPADELLEELRALGYVR